MQVYVFENTTLKILMYFLLLNKHLLLLKIH